MITTILNWHFAVGQYDETAATRTLSAAVWVGVIALEVGCFA